MLFDFALGRQESCPENAKVHHREAVRGVILQEDKLLMVLLKSGDYKFPGGGIDTGESHEEALRREVREETGYPDCEILEKIGVVVEREADAYEEDAFFEMRSHYYLCRVSGRPAFQKLDAYEKELDFCPVWVPLDQALCANEEILRKGTKELNPWVQRETMVLKILKEQKNQIL
ncbi:MAG TPA: NUDIX domain-containing protein [Firmicutes bacterium]|uniref:NUDIX domain-containing protein n=1 Tax=Capillibacterium thermochitinicola TaxID=2699427 RepID=A0A8J6HZC3_9FIRM|nr:NUDIX domain-containing protein [Capillibacterium thermochitinicola]HHW11581.1 NUDIX domain-containing protein [Bacillota bacterium]